MPDVTPGARARSPYLADELTIVMRRSRLGAAWRWRTEMLALAGALAAWWWLARLMSGAVWGGLACGGILVAALAVPRSRRFLADRFWCLVTRHRLQRCFWELRLHTHAGHLPLIVWTRGTRVGERVLVLSRAGMCAADFEDAAPEFAAACGAREARVTASPRWSQLVTIDIVRRDLLRHVVRSPLAGMTGPVTVPAPREDPEPLPGPAAAWPEIGPGGTCS
jgi:hypothetical protein